MIVRGRRGGALRGDFCRRLRAERICRRRRCALRRRDAHAFEHRASGLRSRGGASSRSRRKICASRPSAASVIGNGVNVVDVRHGNDAGFGDVAEQRDFRFQVGGNLAIAAAKQNVGLNSDAEHFLDAVLRGLGFQFAGGGDERNQRDVHEDDVFRAELEAHLADGFEKRKRLDVADRAADFDDARRPRLRQLFGRRL